MKQSTSLGVGPATLTMPSGSARVLGTVRRETIKDPNFYGQFFALVQGYVNQEQISQAATTKHTPPLRAEPPQAAPSAGNLPEKNVAPAAPSPATTNQPSNP